METVRACWVCILIFANCGVLTFVFKAILRNSKLSQKQNNYLSSDISNKVSLNKK